MSLHSIFDPASAPPWTVGGYTDGTPSIILGNYFYITAGATGWECSGARVWIPYDSNVQNKAIRIFAYVVAGSPADLSSAPWRETVTTTTATSGWVEVSWTPISLSPAPSQFLFIGYEITGNPGAYVAVSGDTVTAGSRSAWDSSPLALAEANMQPFLGEGSNRGSFRIGTGATQHGDAWYGVDSIVVESVTPPSGGTAKRWSGTSWIPCPAKMWNGSVWSEHSVKAWNGSSWKAGRV